MKKPLSLIIVIACVVAQTYAQGATITNADVVKVVKAGLSEELVIGAVRQAQTKEFDLSPSALIKLKADGVSERIIAAMFGGGESAAKPEAAGEVVIKDGTEVRLRLVDRITSATAEVNDRVRFEVIEDVLADGGAAIAKGAQALGTVIEAQRKKSFGRSGKPNFTIDVVKAVDDQNVRLRSTKNAKGDENYGEAGVVTILVGPFGALVKGKGVEIEAGTEYPIYIDGDRQIHLAVK